MTSVSVRTRQVSTDSDYFIAISSCVNLIFATPDTSSAVVPWASSVIGVAQNYSTAVSTVNRAGTLFRDMGKSVVSSGVYFRKIQLTVPQGASAAGQVGAGSTSTFGVAGPANVTGVPDFYTGYIKLGFEGAGSPAPVAKFGR
jgi:hypothetical protein